MNDSKMWSALTPELLVENYQRAKTFYVDVFGFCLRFERPEDRFGYLTFGDAQLMLLESRDDTALGPQHAEWKGHGLHFQVWTDNLAALLYRLSEAQHPLVKQPYEVWYRAEDMEYGQREFFVRDLDGFMFRFFQEIGERRIK